MITFSLGSSVLVFWLCRVPFSCINNWRGFVMTFCFKHFNSNRFVNSFLGKFNTITRNLGKLLKREKRPHLRFFIEFWIHLCRVIYIQKYSSRGIPKDNFSERFFKIRRKFSLMEYFSKTFRPKTGLLNGCYTVKHIFVMFS